jgi:hypothetical protein
MSSLMPVGAGALLRHKSFLSFLISRSFSRFASQIGAVAIGWQVYDLTGSAFDLGMIGLVQFLPTALLLFVAGHTAGSLRAQTRVHLRSREALTAVFLAWGAICRLAHGDADFHSDIRARDRGRVRKPGPGRAAAR